MKPWKYRPLEDELDWEDNWLSNSVAWISQKSAPGWCSTEEHWTVKATMYIWAECPCCLAIRGFALGAVAGLAVGLIL